eukprot:14484523-Alexandrium_andersonii.AAC.1
MELTPSLDWTSQVMTKSRERKTLKRLPCKLVPCSAMAASSAGKMSLSFRALISSSWPSKMPLATPARGMVAHMMPGAAR